MSSHGINPESHVSPRPDTRVLASTPPQAGVVADQISNPDRLASLARSGLLDSPPEEAFDRLTRMAARALGTPVALVSLVEDGRQFFKSALGLSPHLATKRQTPLSHSYCQHVVASGQPLIVEDARQHALLHDNPAIDDYQAIAYCGMPLVDLEGRVLGTLCAIDHKPRAWSEEEVSALQDIVRSVTAEVHLRLLSTELADANAALQEFVAVASHDLRNPLTTILGFAEFLVKDELSREERVEFAQVILKQGRRANRLISDLLEVSKLEIGEVRSNSEVVDVPTLIREVIAGRQTDVLEVSIPEDLLVIADRDHLHRVMTNLLDNAVAYGGAPISIRGHRYGARAELEVADAGDGVPAHFVPRLFEKFSRSDYSRSEGTGLGLAITAGLVKASGGSIRYEDNEPHGAKFLVDLPAAMIPHANGVAATPNNLSVQPGDPGTSLT